MPPKYCSKCGKELIKEVWHTWFDPDTGERRANHIWKCPDYVGFFIFDNGHDYVDASGWNPRWPRG